MLAIPLAVAAYILETGMEVKTNDFYWSLPQEGSAVSLVLWFVLIFVSKSIFVLLIIKIALHFILWVESYSVLYLKISSVHDKK